MSSYTYKNVLLVGVSKHILPVLLADSSFNVSILTQTTSNTKFPTNVRVIKVDYADTFSLTKALIGQDVIVSITSGETLANEFGYTLVVAAINADIKWFITSEYGVEDEYSIPATIPTVSEKISVMELLKINQSHIAHTFISTDSATLSNIAKAVIAILHHPELTLNKRFFVADATFIQQEEKTKWIVKHVTNDDTRKLSKWKISIDFWSLLSWF